MIPGASQLFDGLFDEYCDSHRCSTAAGCELWLESHPAARLAGGWSVLALPRSGAENHLADGGRSWPVARRWDKLACGGEIMKALRGIPTGQRSDSGWCGDALRLGQPRSGVPIEPFQGIGVEGGWFIGVARSA
jgi:hypothetical protein